MARRASLALADGAGATMLRDEHVGLGLCFGQLLLQLAQRGLQVLHLRFLVELTCCVKLSLSSR
jgi:hypothetical protein